MPIETMTAAKIGNGSLSLRLRGWLFKRSISIIGGPFPAIPDGLFGICLQETRPNNTSLAIWLPIPDFSVPDDVGKLRDTMVRAIAAALDGEQVYVGCTAGRGRTGLFLSLLAKALGEDKPVEYVREHYYSHAVETKTQYDYVTKFDPTGIARDAWWLYVAMKYGYTVATVGRAFLR